MSVIIDASGGLGSAYAPHFNVSNKGEPSRHELHKIKSTFTKIHGLGTCVYITHSELEVEGANLVLESLFESVKQFLDKRKVRTIRNLYVQLDNVNSNKCFTVIAGVAALIVLGIVKKVKVIYYTFSIAV